MNETVDVTIWSEEQLSLGEGALTHHLRSSLVWCDINGSAVYEKSFDGGATAKHSLPVMPSALAIIDDKRILVATEVDFLELDLDSGESEVAIRFPQDLEMRSNDGRVHPCGAFWIGTMPKDGRSKPGAIWRLFEGELSVMIDNVVIPNSICFAADGSFAYYTDTPHRVIWKIPTDPDSGDVIGEKSIHAELASDIPGGPDGSVVDADGNLWNARWGGASLDVYDPDGSLVHSYALPASQPTCPAFVGAGLNEIVTTSAATGLDGTGLTQSDGAVLQVHAPVRGRAEPIARP